MYTDTFDLFLFLEFFVPPQPHSFILFHLFSLTPFETSTTAIKYYFLRQFFFHSLHPLSFDSITERPYLLVISVFQDLGRYSKNENEDYMLQSHAMYSTVIHDLTKHKWSRNQSSINQRIKYIILLLSSRYDLSNVERIYRKMVLKLEKRWEKESTNWLCRVEERSVLYKILKTIMVLHFHIARSSYWKKSVLRGELVLKKRNDAEAEGGNSGVMHFCLQVELTDLRIVFVYELFHSRRLSFLSPTSPLFPTILSPFHSFFFFLFLLRPLKM